LARQPLLLNIRGNFMRDLSLVIDWGKLLYETDKH
jgi:hypothetical protein